MASFFETNFNRIKDYGSGIFGITIAGKTVADGVQYIHKTERSKARYRERRRTTLRKDVRTVKESELSVETKDEIKTELCLEYTKSSLDDNQSTENIIYDLRATGCIPPDLTILLAKSKNKTFLNQLPNFPSNYANFTLSTRNKLGEVSPVNNPLSIGMPVDSRVDLNKGSSNSRIFDNGSAPLASISLSNTDSNEEYTVTIDDPWTQTVTTKVVQKEELLRLFQNQRIEENTSQETDQCFQSIPANSSPTFIPLNPSSSISSMVLLAVVQFSVFFVVGLPFLEFLQKKVRRTFFFSIEGLTKDLQEEQDNKIKTPLPPISFRSSLKKSEDKKSKDKKREES
uniref:Uncharacterized protein orf341 n=1 Tax=Trebouxia aggregata TaxID=160068 RepID=G8XPF3_9CHLO|nr:hypothetical protein [Trebouxia aggregata]